ncbi:MAG: replicative DNA helicase [Acidimicrobiaceae bacterium]|nr:replicative DNA helicase [Acidimicrobiaceae bacterium]
MSIAEIAQRGEEFERMPPHDVAAEQCVLGGMLLSKDAISDVIEVIRPGDHYRPAHQIVHEAILDLYARGEPADPITVANELTRRGELSRIGGAPYLHTLIASVPTAANAGYYARIVRERAILRRLVEAGTRIVQLGYSGDSDADDLVDRAQAEVYGVTDRRIAEDYHPLSEIMPGALEEIEAISAHGGGISGVPTGFADLDALTNGLHPGQMIVIAARPAVGKALALDTPLPTPVGWTTMGEVQVGDYLMGADGKPTRVVAATEVMHGRPCYEVLFDDGTAIVADELHQWRTTTRAERRQTAQRVTRHYWTRQQTAKVHQAAAAARREPDRLVTTSEAAEEVGREFLTVIKARVLKRVACAGRMPRRSARRVSPRLGMRTYTLPVPVYSRRELLSALAEHVEIPAAAAQAHVHELVKTTAAIAASLYSQNRAERRLNHAVPVALPLDLPDQELPLPPYVLGVWAGDGSTNSATFTSADPEVASLVEAEGIMAPKLASRYAYGLRLPRIMERSPDRNCLVCGKPFTPATSDVMTCGRVCGAKSRIPGTQRRVQPTCPRCGNPFTGITSGRGMCRACIGSHGSVQAVLRALGVLGDKHLPESYLRASEKQRRALLAGLLDTDGTVTSGGSVQFTVTSCRLARDVRDLITGLGYRCGWSERPVSGRTTESSTGYTLTFTTTDDVFRLARKRAVHRDRRPSHTTPRTSERFITAVRPVPSVPVRCVQVDSADHLYLASESMIPTHNSALALDFARSATIRHGLPTVVFSLEMGRNEITMRLLSAEARVPMHVMRTGQMSDDDWGRLAKRMSEVADAPLFIDDSPNMSLMEIRAKCRRLKQRHDLKLVIIDYLQLMSSPKRVESRQQEVSELSRSLKLLAKELEVPVVALSQLNRGPEQRQDKKPMLSDLRESGSIEQDSDVVILLHREDAYERESPRAGEADLIVAKHRNGPTATVTVAFQGHYSRFVDMAPG